MLQRRDGATALHRRVALAPFTGWAGAGRIAGRAIPRHQRDGRVAALLTHAVLERRRDQGLVDPRKAPRATAKGARGQSAPRRVNGAGLGADEQVGELEDGVKDGQTTDQPPGWRGHRLVYTDFDLSNALMQAGLDFGDPAGADVDLDLNDCPGSDGGARMESRAGMDGRRRLVYRVDRTRRMERRIVQRERHLRFGTRIVARAA